VDPKLASSVIKELNNKILEAENNQVELENISKYAEMVKVSDDNLKFVGPKISDIKSRNIIGKAENLDYFLRGLKNKNNGSIKRALNFSITYTSDERRNYT
jgi:predicted RNA-binding protein with EMAP domain